MFNETLIFDQKEVNTHVNCTFNHIQMNLKEKPNAQKWLENKLEHIEYLQKIGKQMQININELCLVFGKQQH